MRDLLPVKLLVILVVVVGAALIAFPPEDKINLGLDLRGGAHILMQVERESTIKYEMDAGLTRAGQALTDRGITYDSVLATGDTTLEIRGTPVEAADTVRDIAQTWLGDWQLDSLGSGNWRLTMPPQRLADLGNEAVDTALSTIRRRIDGLGVSEPIVQKQGIAGDRILIQLPGVEDPTRVKEVIGDTRLLEWKEVKYPPSAGANPCASGWVPPLERGQLVEEFGGQIPDDAEVFPEKLDQLDGTTITRWWPLKRVSVVRGTDLIDARVGLDEWSNAQINFELSQEAGRRFEEATKQNIGCVMAIVLGDTQERDVLSAPVIQNAIRDRGRILGQYDVQSAENLALALRSGAIPTDLRIIQERTIGPSLGRDSIRSGLTAGIAGFLGVMLFMLVYYRLAGVNAVVALTLNVLLVFGLLAAIPWLFAGAQATLTLPGIAGLILTVGMAVDANVLIFERIREELRLGKTIRSAVEQGFRSAFGTIIDCNITTLVAAFFLFSYGTGPVKGFAVTLTIGLLASLFTSVFVSRQLFEIVLRSKRREADNLSI